MTRIVAVTGGTGFLGAALIDRLLADGVEVRALARTPTKLARWNQAIDEKRVQPVVGNLSDVSALARLAENASGFIHCAGLTNARRDEEYRVVNVDGAAAAATAARGASVRFVHISSLSARLPTASPYAASKKESETAVAAASAGNPHIALRAPAIYGPGDLATLPYFKMVKAGIAPEPATPTEARASLLFVGDVAGAAVAALAEGESGGIYELGDDRKEGRTWREIGETLALTLQVKTRRVRIPRPLVALWHGALRSAASIGGSAPGVRSGQINEFFHPDWVARDNLFADASAWRPLTGLQEGFAKTVRWYQENGLL